jgi:uncharacterized membrane protein
MDAAKPATGAHIRNPANSGHVGQKSASLTMADDRNTSKAGADASAFFASTDRPDEPIYEITLRPHQSLPIKGFVWVIGITATLMTLPLWPLLGSLAFLGLLPFLLLALGLLWYFIQRNYHDRSLHETLRLWPDLITIHRHNPREADQYWQANPYWVRLKLHKDHATENYLTLTGSDREVELGAFLTKEERQDLYDELFGQLRRCKSHD